MTNRNDAMLDIGRLKPPRTPREWIVHVPIPDGVEIGDHATHDRLAAAAAPEGYVLGGTIPVRRAGAPADDRGSWRIRIKYVPASWRRQLHAPIEVYSLAQLAGVPTHLDDVLVASDRTVQWYAWDGRPSRCQSCTPHERMPEELKRAVRDIWDLHRRQRSGYFDNLPCAYIASQRRLACERRAKRAKETIRAWVMENYPQIVEHYVEEPVACSTI